LSAHNVPMTINTQGIQHEHEFPKPGVNCPCRDSKNNNKEEKKCKKMVAIFYRFSTSSENKCRKWYTYVKLESTATQSLKGVLKHIGHAVTHHWLGKVKAQKEGMHVRRENLVQLPQDRFEALKKIKPKDLKNNTKVAYFKNLGITKQNIYQYLIKDQTFYGSNQNQLKKLQNYNENVRRANEFYVTTELYNRIDRDNNLDPIDFFTTFFKEFLKPQGMCFESGAMVFEGDKMYNKLIPKSGARAGARILPAQSHSMIKYVPWSKLGLDNSVVIHKYD
jgi:hypothetical protein